MRHIHAVVMLYHTAAGHHTVAPGHFLGSKVGIPDNGENFLYLEFPKSVFLTGDSHFRAGTPDASRLSGTGSLPRPPGGLPAPAW